MNGQTEKQHINLHIYDTDIAIRVPREQEEQYRLAGKLINEKLNAYFNAYKGKKGDKEITYFAMIDIALTCVTEAKRNDVSPFTDILSQLSSEIAEALK
ncbi:MAG: cell division protein ZapA [Prevotella sp.]|nr:cell division protein ZapA [Prevotella sp.]MBR1839429.1 cell division protein ZapA [Prevotella sp.]